MITAEDIEALADTPESEEQALAAVSKHPNVTEWAVALGAERDLLTTPEITMNYILSRNRPLHDAGDPDCDIVADYLEELHSW